MTLIKNILTIIMMGIGFSIAIVVPFTLYNYVVSEHEKQDHECIKVNISESKCTGWDEQLECAKDCMALDMNYFKYQEGGFANDICFCVIDKEPKQIW